MFLLLCYAHARLFEENAALKTNSRRMCVYLFICCNNSNNFQLKMKISIALLRMRRVAKLCGYVLLSSFLKFDSMTVMAGGLLSQKYFSSD